MIKFLNMINKACYENGYRKTLPFSEERERVIDKYVEREKIINKLSKKLNYFKKG